MVHTTVISLGGSIVVPDDIDVSFVTRFARRMKDRLARDPDWRLALVIGGGATARRYQHAARDLAVDCSTETLDRIGIAATRVNAEIVRAAFAKLSPGPVVTDPTDPGVTSSRVVIAGGWKPGFSTDNVTVHLAESLGSRALINLSNITQVFTADPRTNPDAEPMSQISWAGFMEISAGDWTPGKNTPFDPVATRRAAGLHMRVIVANGRDLGNLDAILENREFIGTTIGPE